MWNECECKFENRCNTVQWTMLYTTQSRWWKYNLSRLFMGIRFHDSRTREFSYIERQFSLGLLRYILVSIYLFLCSLILSLTILAAIMKLLDCWMVSEWNLWKHRWIDYVVLDVCYQPICDFFVFPADCSLPNADIICGRFCGNPMCGSRPIRRRRTQQRNRIRSQKPSQNRHRSQKRHRKG